MVSHSVIVDNVCPVCDKKFARKQAVVQHIKNVHKVKSFCAPGNIKCGSPGCTFSCCTLESLRKHVQSKHDFKLEQKKLKFHDYQEFLQWKTEEETRTTSKFVLRAGIKRLSMSRKKCYYGCHRSGTFQSRSTGQRQLKSQGTCKIGFTCPAGMDVEDLGDKIHVIYYKTHFGHDAEIGHLTLTESFRAEIAKMLARGVPMEKILDDVRKTVTDDVKRSDLLTRQDLKNIARDFNIFHSERMHHIDSESKGRNSQASLEEFEVEYAYPDNSVPLSEGEDGKPTYVVITLHEGNEAPHAIAQINNHRTGAIEIEPDQSSDHSSTESLQVSCAPPNAKIMTNVVPSTFRGSFIDGESFPRKSNKTSADKGSPNCASKWKMEEYCQLEYEAKMKLYQIQCEVQELKKQVAIANLEYVNEQREYLTAKRQLLELSHDDL